MICIYKNNLQKKDLEYEDQVFIFNNNISIDIAKEYKLIPLVGDSKNIEIKCLISAYSYFKDKNKKINFKINNNNKKEGILQFCCINSFKKRKLVKSQIDLIIDPENFKIELKEIPEIIKLLEFFNKKNLINLEEYFFGFLINYYFYLKLRD